MSFEQQIKPCVLLIATRKYVQFIPDVVRQLDRFFMPNREIAVMIFSDQYCVPNTTARVDIVFQHIEELKWPYATLYRYKIFSRISEYLLKFSHLYYSDVDMGYVDTIGDEFLVDGLLAVKHPAFSSGGWGSPNNSQQSSSWFPEEKRKQYYCGGVQGGKSEVYLQACKKLADRISQDEMNKVMAEWHDETHWNKYTNCDHPELVTALGPEYCMVEQMEFRKNWKIDHLKPKIIALAKNHEEIRQ